MSSVVGSWQCSQPKPSDFPPEEKKDKKGRKKDRQTTSPRCGTGQTQPGGLCRFLVCFLEGRIMLEH